jgi:lysozyme
MQIKFIIFVTMKISNRGLQLIKDFEGFYAKPYLDPVNVITIGYGVIKYPDGKRVTMTDKAITEKQASDMLQTLIDKTYAPAVNRQVKVQLTQNQIDALISFTYNLGETNLSQSTLLKKINANPCDPTIANEFAKWVNAGGKKLNGLVRRRKAESDLYFSKEK